jgi:hypothetical protein
MCSEFDLGFTFMIIITVEYETAKNEKAACKLYLPIRANTAS